MKRYAFIILLAAVFFMGIRSSFAQTEASPSKTSSETRVEKLTRDSGLPFGASLEPSKPLLTVVPSEYRNKQRRLGFDFDVNKVRKVRQERY